MPQEELPEELRGQRVFRRRINGRGRGYSRRSYRNPRQGGGGGSSPSPSPPPGQEPFGRQQPRCQPTWVYIIQGPTGPIGPPGQDGRDGRDGANAALVNIPQPVQPAPIVQHLNATALENFFDRVGQSITDVLTEQKVANHRMREHLEANNETLQDQTDAMVALADIARKQSYDNMFAAIPIFDGSQPELFNDWMESIETLCALSGRDPRTGYGKIRTCSPKDIKKYTLKPKLVITKRRIKKVCIRHTYKSSCSTKEARNDSRT